METKIIPILEIVYLEDWNTHAYICTNGSIYIMLIEGRMFDRKQWESHIKEQITFFSKGYKESFKIARINLFISR